LSILRRLAQTPSPAGQTARWAEKKKKRKESAGDGVYLSLLGINPNGPTPWRSGGRLETPAKHKSSSLSRAHNNRMDAPCDNGGERAGARGH